MDIEYNGVGLSDHGEPALNIIMPPLDFEIEYTDAQNLISALDDYRADKGVIWQTEIIDGDIFLTIEGTTFGLTDEESLTFSDGLYEEFCEFDGTERWNPFEG